MFIPLDGGWRVLHGQRPHVDFYSSFGPIPYLLAALGLAVSHGTVAGLIVSTIVAGLTLSVWSALVARARLRFLPAAAYFLFVLCFCFAPFPIGELFYTPSYAMQYNRWGYILTSLVLVEVLGSSPTGDRRDFAGGLSTGAAIGVLFFLKFNFFVVAACIALTATLLYKKRPGHSLGIGIGFLGVALALLSYLGWHAGSIFHDLALTARARGARVKTLEPIKAVVRNLVAIVTMIAVAAVAYRDELRGFAVRMRRGLSIGDSVQMIRSPWVGIVGLALGADIALFLSNTQRYGFPLSVVAVVLLCGIAPGWSARSAERQVLMLIPFLVVLPTIGDSINGWVSEQLVKSQSVGSVINAKPLQSIRFIGYLDPFTISWGLSNGAPYVDRVNDGLDLMRGHSSATDRLACLCFSNPFTIGLGLPPQHGGATFYDYAVNITEAVHPSPEWIIGNATLVIYPIPEDRTKADKVILAECGPILGRSFHIVGESKYWVLLGLNREGTAQPAS